MSTMSWYGERKRKKVSHKDCSQCHLIYAVPFLPVREDFHPKRNQARQKLATLPISRFEDLSSDVYYELSRRYPEFKEDVSSIVSPAANDAHLSSLLVVLLQGPHLTTTQPLGSLPIPRLVPPITPVHLAGHLQIALLIAAMVVVFPADDLQKTEGVLATPSTSQGGGARIPMAQGG